MSQSTEQHRIARIGGLAGATEEVWKECECIKRYVGKIDHYSDPLAATFIRCNDNWVASHYWLSMTRSTMVNRCSRGQVVFQGRQVRPSRCTIPGPAG